MAFAGHCGLDINLDALDDDTLAVLFNEELGGVIQIRDEDAGEVDAIFRMNGLSSCVHTLGSINTGYSVEISHEGHTVFSEDLQALQRAWSETSYRIQDIRDNSDCARQEFDSIRDDDPGLSVSLSFDPADDITAPYINKGAKPRIAILREQGVNGQLEMAAAFDRAGFEAFDVHMSDIINGKLSLDDFRGLAACGGFSYGDVLGAGEGWAKSILFNARARDVFENYFKREDTFSLGVCNGCQMMANLKSLIPGADHWPHFVRNQSEQFEARFSLVEVVESPSIMYAGMAGSRMPVAVAHGEGRAEYHDKEQQQSAIAALRYVDNHGDVTENYPANPNGSPLGNTGFTTTDGRVTIMMPHPERVFRAVQNSWYPEEWGEDSPWMRLFRNARVWVS